MSVTGAGTSSLWGDEGGIGHKWEGTISTHPSRSARPFLRSLFSTPPSTQPASPTLLLTLVLYPTLPPPRPPTPQFRPHLSANTSRGPAPSAQRFTIQAASKAAKKPRATPVPRGQKGCRGRRIGNSSGRVQQGCPRPDDCRAIAEGALTHQATFCSSLQEADLFIPPPSHEAASSPSQGTPVPPHKGSGEPLPNQ